MALSHGQPYTGAEGNVPGFAGAGQLAQELTQQACQGMDPPLAMQLPHTKAMQSRKGVQTPPFQNLSNYFIDRMSVESPAPPLAAAIGIAQGLHGHKTPPCASQGCGKRFLVPYSSRDAFPLKLSAKVRLRGMHGSQATQRLRWVH